MDSDLHQHHHHHHLHNHQLQSQLQNTMNSNNSSAGLTRYRSAPSSYFADLISSGIYGDDDNDPFFNSAAAARVSNNQQSSDQFLNQIGGGGYGDDHHQSQFIDSSSSAVKQEQEVIYSESPQQQQQHYMYQNQNQFQSETTDHNIQQQQPPSSTVDNSTINIPGNLLRQSSSPAGFFAHLDVDNGYSVMRSMDDYRSADRGSNPLLSSTKRMKKEMGFSSGSLSSSGTLPCINEGKVMEMKSAHDDGGFGSHSWDDSDILSDSFLKELGVESDQNKLSSLINPSENQNDVGRIRAPTTLIHHLSLPASTAELDKLLQFQDSVPLRSRAKRGCATHPRSIAERVRRTRISERMRKLQELVPNMDKQTNTADMLDLAVDYIKELQKEAETLTDHHAKCTCPHKQKAVTQA